MNRKPRGPSTCNHLSVLIARFGGQRRLASMIGKSQAAISDWVKAGRVPSDMIPVVIEVGASLSPPVQLEPNDFFDLARRVPVPASHAGGQPGIRT